MTYNLLTLTSVFSLRTFDSATCNGFIPNRSPPLSSMENIQPATPPPTPPSPRSRPHYQYPSQEDEEDGFERIPLPPKRRSRSRGTSLVQDDDRTSRGADSLPDVNYDDDMVTPRSSSREPSLPAYAVIEKRDRPPRPPPPRRKPRRSTGSRFATVPRRPKRIRSPARGSLDSMPFHDDGSEGDLACSSREADLFLVMRDRLVPTPHRPPRTKRNRKLRRDLTPELSETAASTQTDPMPDECGNVEEFMEEDGEVTRAKLVVTPTRSGSQIKISTERIPSPTSARTSNCTPPSIPPLPQKQKDVDKKTGKCL